jgi:heat-inducible transcriptional repressor
VHTPPPADQHVAQLRWMRLRPGQLLAVVVTRSGAIENRVVSVEHEPDAQELERLHNYLESLIGQRTLSELRALVARAAETERSALSTRASLVMEATACAAVSNSREVMIEGQQRLLGQPDFASVDKMRSVLSALGERERLLELLDRTMAAGGVQVLIGAETKLSDGQDLSLISASYGQLGRGTGTLALIGPTRIDYQKVIPLVSCAANLLTDLLEKDNGSS